MESNRLPNVPHILAEYDAGKRSAYDSVKTLCRLLNSRESATREERETVSVILEFCNEMDSKTDGLEERRAQ